jgi:hypothetical protein
MNALLDLMVRRMSLKGGAERLLTLAKICRQSTLFRLGSLAGSLVFLSSGGASSRRPQQ